MSVQQDNYLAARALGRSMHGACVEADFPLAEARFVEAAIGRGEIILDVGRDSDPPANEAPEIITQNIPAPAPIGHNSKETTMTINVAADQLRLFIERAERVKEEIKGLQGDLKDIFAEAKGQGYDPATMRQIIKERAMDKDKRDEREALLDTYRHALGLLADLPLGQAAMARAA